MANEKRVEKRNKGREEKKTRESLYRMVLRRDAGASEG